ncbi:MAG: hypothetical protein QXV23_04835 [Candidatus Bathyarchaeia archaeon]
MLTSKGIFVRGIDRKNYRKLKALAAERGTSVYVLIDDAIRKYLATASSETSGDMPLSEEAVNNTVFRKVRSDPSVNGRWIGIAGGRVVKVSDRFEEVVESMRQAYRVEGFKHGIVAKAGAPPDLREWLAGSLQSV